MLVLLELPKKIQFDAQAVRYRISKVKKKVKWSIWFIVVRQFSECKQPSSLLLETWSRLKLSNRSRWPQESQEFTEITQTAKTITILIFKHNHLLQIQPDQEEESQCGLQCKQCSRCNKWQCQRRIYSIKQSSQHRCLLNISFLSWLNYNKNVDHLNRLGIPTFWISVSQIGVS